MTKDILDGGGNVIGQLTLSDDTTDDVWAAQLATYANPPSPTIPPTPTQTASDAMDFGKYLIAQLGAESEMNALTTDQMVQLIQLIGPIQLMLMAGALGTALYAMQNTDFTGLLSDALVQEYENKLSTYLGVATS